MFVFITWHVCISILTSFCCRGTKRDRLSPRPTTRNRRSNTQKFFRATLLLAVLT